MARENSTYTVLAEKLGVPNSERFLKILEEMFTTDEAAICRELFTPATCAELSAKLDIEEKKMTKMLDKLVDRSIITRGPTQYAFHTTLLAFHHETVADTAPQTGPNAVTKKVKKLWNDFFYNEWSFGFLNEAIKRQQAGGRSLPIWPAIEAIERSPNIKPEDLLPEENFKLRIENAKSRILAPCGCRVSWGDCNHPLMTCFACFDRPRGEYYLNLPGSMLKRIGLAESLDTARMAEEAGLVHWGDCYCCSCSCENLFPVTRAHRFDLMEPNRFLAVTDQGKCKGCERCLKRCPFEAIEMKKVDNSGKMKAVVSAEKCKGCGVCITGCKHNAITYRIVRPPEYLKPKVTQGQSGRPVHVIPVWGRYDLE
jgi:Pyruvate/2-oxoacid:ferredoxin oxidoreductase delta subunit